MKRLARNLRINRAWAVGILECLWHWAGRYAPQGDIGRFADADLAEAVSWPKEPAELIEALVESEWVDKDAAFRLVIHDWEDHAEESVKKFLRRNKLPFIKAGSFVQTIAGHGETFAEKVCLPEPVPIPKPKPEPAPVSVSACLCLKPPWNSQECASDFDEWFAYLVTIGKPAFDRDLAMVSLSQLFSCPEDFRQAALSAMSNGWGSVSPSMVKTRKRRSSDDTITDADVEGMR